MIITAHQPNYLPWIGLFHKIYLANFHVIYDDVEFTHYGFTNRADILGKDGFRILTVPVLRPRAHQPRIFEVCIDNSNERWRRKHWLSIEHCYGRCQYFETYASDLEAVYRRHWDCLADLNVHLLELILDFLGIKKPTVRASSLGLHGRGSDRIIDLCQKLGAEAFIFGSSGRRYADLDSFRRANVEPLFQNYRHPSYPRSGGQGARFMSAIDLLFNCGPESLNVILRGQDKIDDLRLGSNHA